MSVYDDFMAAQKAQPSTAPARSAPPSVAQQFAAAAQMAGAQPPQPNGGGLPGAWQKHGGELGYQAGRLIKDSINGVTGLPLAAGDAFNTTVNHAIDGINSLAGTSINHWPLPSQDFQSRMSTVFPQARNARERVADDMTSTLAGLSPTNALGKTLTKAAAPTSQAIGKMLTAVPGNQMVGAAAAGGAAGSAREAGLGPAWQAALGLLGGLAGTGGAGAVGSAVMRARNAIAPPITNLKLAPAAVESAVASSPLPPSPAAQQELTRSTATILANTPGADAMSAARAADAKRLGMHLTLGQVTRDPALFAQEQNWRGTDAGRPLLSKFNTQNAQLAKALSGAVGPGQEPYQGGKQIITALQDIDSQMRDQVSGAYKAAEQSSGAKLNVPLNGLAQDYAQVLHDFGDKVPSGVRNQFESLGLMSGNQQKVFSIDDAEKVLKVINDNRGADRATNNALMQLGNSVKAAILGADDQGGVFAAPRQLAAQRFALHDQVPALADAAAGAIAPEDFTRKYLVNGDTDHVKALVDLLQGKNPDALEIARGQVGDQLRNSAFGMNMAGDKAFSPERYARALQNVGGQEKLTALYGPDIVDDLYAIGRVGSYIHSEPAFSPVNRSNTGSAVLDMASEIPMVGKAISAVGKKQMIARALAGQLQDTGQIANTPGAGAGVVINAARPPAPVQQDGN